LDVNLFRPDHAKNGSRLNGGNDWEGISAEIDVFSGTNN
jgi:hypothetical protein